MALPIWALYYKRLYADKSLKVSDKAFPRPANLSIELDCDKAEEELPKDGEPTDKPAEEEDDGF
jgi:penicillin-binding protein 1A